ncbi:MAG: hypothetical protein ACFFD4_00290 [Candidatus Odinarchaeota archaeon]
MTIIGKRTNGTVLEKNTSIKEKILDLSGLKLVSLDLSPLAECIILNKLFLGDNQLVSLDLSPLAACKELVALSLQNNHLESLDLSPLAACTKLVTLSLQNNHLESLDLSPLAACKALTHLSTDPEIQLLINRELLKELLPRPIEVLRPQLQQTMDQLPRLQQTMDQLQQLQQTMDQLQQTMDQLQQIIDDFIEFDNAEHLSLKYTARQLLQLLLSDDAASINPDNIDENARDAIRGILDKFAQLIKLEGKEPPPDSWLIEYCFEQSAALRQGIKDSQGIKDLLKKRLRQQLLGEIPAGETEEVSVSMQEEIDKLLKKYKEL